MQSGRTPQIIDYYSNLETPEVTSMELQLQQLVEQGVLTPEDAQAALVGESAMGGITLDPNLKQAQLDALAGLQDISSSGGMTLSDQANLNKIQGDLQTQARGSREAILQNAQMRGMGGSGLEMLSQMQNQQDAATRANQAGTDTAASARDRALQALIQGGETAGNIRGQDFNEKSQIAQAQDAISKFNAQNQQQINMTNTAARNNAQAANLQNKQNIANQNTANANMQQQYNKNLKQQDFQNKKSIADGRSGIATQNAANQGANSQGAANAFNNMVGIGATVAGGFFGGPAGAYTANKIVSEKKHGGLVMGDPSDEDTMPHMLQPGEMVVRKEDVPDYLKKKHTNDDGDFDAGALLDELTGFKFNYSKKEGRT